MTDTNQGISSNISVKQSTFSRQDHLAAKLETQTIKVSEDSPWASVPAAFLLQNPQIHGGV